MDIFLAEGKITYKILGGNIEMYFFTGPSPLDVLRQYTDFIGKPFMPPLWSLGVHQCRWGYDKVKVAMDVVKAHKDINLPLDALWLDIEYVSHTLCLCTLRMPLPTADCVSIKLHGPISNVYAQSGSLS